MSLHYFFFIITLLLSGCSMKRETLTLSYNTLQTQSAKTSLLNNISLDEMQRVKSMFEASCLKKRFSEHYSSTCKASKNIPDARVFFTQFFDIKKIISSTDENLMTGYYEATLYGSKTKSARYQFPIYATPQNMKEIYFERSVINKVGLNAKVLCYVDSQLDRYFLHVQGSGRVMLDDGETLFLGFASQNGYGYTSIGKEMIKRGYIAQDKISLQSIKAYFDKNPFLLSEILEVNKSYIFFHETHHSAMGALGVELTPFHSVATDLSYIPLGTLLLYKANDLEHLAIAQDTGGAIKGEVRADLFFGFGADAKQKAGKMNHYLDLWVLVPKERDSNKQ